MVIDVPVVARVSFTECNFSASKTFLSLFFFSLERLFFLLFSLSSSLYCFSFLFFYFLECRRCDAVERNKRIGTTKHFHEFLVSLAYSFVLWTIRYFQNDFQYIGIETCNKSAKTNDIFNFEKKNKRKKKLSHSECAPKPKNNSNGTMCLPRRFANTGYCIAV